MIKVDKTVFIFMLCLSIGFVISLGYSVFHGKQDTPSRIEKEGDFTDTTLINAMREEIQILRDSIEAGLKLNKEINKKDQDAKELQVIADSIIVITGNFSDARKSVANAKGGETIIFKPHSIGRSE